MGDSEDDAGDKHRPMPIVPPPSHQISLSRRLEDTNRHPVLIFGSAASGKSSLILSIINALSNAPEVNVFFSDNEPILDDSYGELQRQKHAQARQFYDWGIYGWAAGDPPPPNIGDRFFIPIDVQPKNSTLPPVKFAILDGRGEDYEPLTSRVRGNAPIGEVRRPLGDEIRELLTEFSHEITLVYVAPYSQHGVASEDTVDANTGLRLVLEQYGMARSLALRALDSHIFLFTKWDEMADPRVVPEQFTSPTSLDVGKQLSIRYEGAWGQFRGLPLSGVAGERRVFMQYSAGYFIEGRLRRPPELHEKTFKKYPRTVANWLYSRAARSSLRQRQLDEDILQDIFVDVKSNNDQDGWVNYLVDLIVGNVRS